ncbi:peptidoglycan D,D-transpeptidase FtsI family protein [Brevibacillus daliensis]|uniref:peptidoglycan D,D-transpeptidase FtsI family protein n=1 Tax=Brevibacillus daliensis TaxID=2892995 RepID=UPI001E3758E7|nr:penicillin-binding transpeptidase domain-containing protein [Brevibacillus daliensis]
MDTSEKNMEKQERSNRVQIIFLIAFLLFCSIVLRLAYLQLVQGETFEAVLDSRTSKKDPIPAVRGNIYDRNGKLLVFSRGSFTAVFHEKEGLKKEEAWELSTHLARVLPRMDAAKVLKKMDAGYALENGKVIPSSRRAPKYLEKEVAYDLTPEIVAYIEEHRQQLPGIDVVSKPIRVYDQRKLAVQAIGYVRPYYVAENIGSSFYQEEKGKYLPTQLVGLDGIERSYEKELRGENGYRNYEVTADQNVLHEGNKVAPKRGNNLYLTIDERVQLDVRNYIEEFLPKLRSSISIASQARSAYAVAMEVKTGKIVAMVSYPEYDPNLWVQGPDENTYEQIKYAATNGTIREAPYDVRPLTGKIAEWENNKHPKSVVPVGSAVKPITVLLGLQEGLIKSNDRWQDTGVYYYGRGTDKIRNDEGHIYGMLNPERAIQKSSNTYMARIGQEFARKRKASSVEVLSTYYHAFGLGVTTGINLPGEQEGKEDFKSMGKQYGPLAAMVQASFGQQIRATTMQLTQYAATLANKGVRVQPQLVDRIVTGQGDVIFQSKPVVQSKWEAPESYWNVIKNGMMLVTKPGGTAVQSFRDLPYDVAAKTGTSEQDIYIPVSFHDSITKKSKTRWSKYARVNNGVIISFAPADNPKLAVAVVVPEGGYGGRSASEICRAIYQAYDKHIGLD